MNLSITPRRAAGIAALGLSLVAVPSAVSAAPAASFRVPATATASSSTTITSKTTVTYTVIAGTFKSKAGAQARLKAVEAKGVQGLKVVAVRKTRTVTVYRLEDRGLSKASAKALVASLHAHKYFAFYVAV